jgi:hypothetical protein
LATGKNVFIKKEGGGEGIVMETACGRRPWVVCVSSTLKVLQDKGQPHLLIRRKSGRWFLSPPSSSSCW